MADTWVGVVNSTKPKYMKGYEDLCLRNRLRLAMLKRRGRIKYNSAGEFLQEQLMFSRPQSQQYADGSALDFSNHQPLKKLRLDWRGYVNTDSITMMQRAQNEGSDVQLVNLYQTKINNLMQGITDDFNGETYRDGGATGRENAIHGLETFLGAGTVASTDRIVAPSDTYGLDSLSTVPATYGGVWTNTLTGGTTAPNDSLDADWPDGYGDPEYDFMSPKLINYSASTWGTGATTWEANCWRVISQAITWLTVTGGKDGQPTLISLAPNLFQGYKNHHEALRRINIPHKEGQDLGFTGVLNQDGVAINSDFDIAPNVGYVENLETVTIHSLMPQLFWSIDQFDKADKVDIRTLSYLMVVGFFGNCSYKPKHVGKIYAAA